MAIPRDLGQGKRDTSYSHTWGRVFFRSKSLRNTPNYSPQFPHNFPGSRNSIVNTFPLFTTSGQPCFYCPSLLFFHYCLFFHCSLGMPSRTIDSYCTYSIVHIPLFCLSFVPSRPLFFIVIVSFCSQQTIVPLLFLNETMGSYCSAFHCSISYCSFPIVLFTIVL